jgi:nucleoside-diphosphate-sugar epimerase
MAPVSNTGSRWCTWQLSPACAFDRHPHAYVDANLEGFVNVLAVPAHGCRHLIYASSSSVYGVNETAVFRR